MPGLQSCCPRSRHVSHDGPSGQAYGSAVRQSGQFECGSEMNLRYNCHLLLLWYGSPLTAPLVWQTMHTLARPPTPPKADPPRIRDDRRGRGGLRTSTLKIEVRIVAQMSSRICRAIVVVLILTALIVNVWSPYARPPLSSLR
jgi:hypothetical protein